MREPQFDELRGLRQTAASCWYYSKVPVAKVFSLLQTYLVFLA